MNRKLLSNILITIILAAIIIGLPVALKSDYWSAVFNILAINILLVSSLRTIKVMGYISLGHVGFSLIGAYGSALLVMKLGLPFWIALLLGGLMSAIISLALAYPFLRVKGVYFVLLTLLTAETFRIITYYWKDLTGGFHGLIQIPPPNPITIPGIGLISFDTANNYYYITVVIVSLSLFVLYRLEHSHLGFKWRIIQDTDVLAESVGINVMWYKALNFTIAGFFAGIAGALFAHYQHGLSPDFSARFGLMMSIYLLLYMVVGGEAKFRGPIIGIIVLTAISELTRGLGAYQPIMFGAIAIFIMLLMPEGLIGLPDRIKLWYRKLLKQTGKVQGPT